MENGEKESRRRPGIGALWALAVAFCLAVPSRAQDEAALGRAYEALKAQAASFEKGGVRKARPQAELVPVVVYHTNDVHGQIGPTAASANRGWAASGGAASLATLLKQESRSWIWIDSGDWFQGTPEGNLTKGEAVIAVFNRLGLTAGLLGNHDFDYGEGNAKNLAGKAAFDVLGSNIEDEGSGLPVPYVKPYVLKDVLPGVRIGIFGVTTSQMCEMVAPEKIRGLKFQREVDCALPIASALRKQGADVVLAASHLGIEEYGGKSYGIKEGDAHLAKSVPDIDVILGGHTHTEMATPLVVPGPGGKETLITQTRGMLSSVYQIVLYVEAGTGDLDHIEAKLIHLDPSLYPPDPEVEKLIGGYKAAADKEMGRVIGSAAAALPLKSAEESPIAVWAADVLRRRGGADIGVVNTFGVRAELAAGSLTYGDIYKVMPFDNYPVKLELSGAELRKLVEQNLLDDVLWLQYSGLKIEYDPKAPLGSRVLRLESQGAEVSPAGTYTVMTMDFTANVDKGFKGIRKKVLEMGSVLVRDLLIEEVEKNSPISAAGGVFTRR